MVAALKALKMSRLYSAVDTILSSHGEDHLIVVLAPAIFNLFISMNSGIASRPSHSPPDSLEVLSSSERVMKKRPTCLTFEPSISIQETLLPLTPTRIHC